MGGDFSALAYLEWRTQVNTWRQTLRTPAKLVMFLFGIAYFAFFVWLRFSNLQKHGVSKGLQEPYATLFFCGMLAFFVAVPGWVGARGSFRLFTSFADARFLVCSRLQENHVIPFMVLRGNLLAIIRFALIALFYALVFAVLGDPVPVMFGLLGTFAIGSAMPSFMFRVRVLLGTTTAYAFVGALSLVTLLPAAAIGAGALWAGAQPLAHWALALGFGRAVGALFSGNITALLAPYVIFLLLVIASFLGARDLYPELYAASLTGMNAVAQRGRGRASAVAAKASANLPKSAPSSAIPRGMSGAWAILWKDWVAFRRAIGGQWLLAIGSAVALGCGTIVGNLVRSPATSQFGDAALSTVLSTAFFIVSMMATIELQKDVGKPIWWLSTSSLRVRLYVWTLATGWRTMLPLALGMAAFGVASGNIGVAVAGVPATVVAIAFLRSIGIALYTIFPWNGGAGTVPGMLRMLLSVLAWVPPAIVLTLAAAISQQVVVGAIFAALAMLAEAALFLDFAAACIAGNGVAFAREAS